MLADDTYEGWADDLARLVRAPAAVPADVRNRLQGIWPPGWSVPAILAALACLPDRHSPAADAAIAIALDLLDRAFDAQDKADRSDSNHIPLIYPAGSRSPEAVAEALDRARRTAGQRGRDDLDYRGLVRLAGWLPDGSPLWRACMNALVQVAMAVAQADPRRAREPIARWADRFLEAAPARTRADYQAAAFLLTRFPVTDADVLFPRLLPALDDPHRRACVLGIANSHFPPQPSADSGEVRRATIPTHPLVGRLDYLAHLIAGAGEAGATEDAVADALAACRTLYRLPGPEAAAMLADTLTHPAPAVRLETADALRGWGDQRARRVFAEMWNDPRTHSAAMMYIPDELEYEEDFLEEGLYSPRARIKDWLGRTEFNRRVTEIGTRVGEWLGGSGALPPGVEVLARHAVVWPGSPTSDVLCVVRHSFPCGPNGEAAELTLSGTSHGWTRYNRDVSTVLACQQEVVSIMYLRGLWAVDKVDDRRSPYEQLFARWSDEPLTDLRVRAVAELHTALGGGMAAVATARRHGTWCWVVVHGRRAAWYPSWVEGDPGYAVGALGRFVAFEILGLGRSPTA